MRTIHLTIITKVIIQVDEGVEIGTILESANPTLGLTDDRATEIDCEIETHEITDSR